MHVPDVTSSTLKTIADEVLVHLRRAFGRADLNYATVPERVFGGFDTLILGCRLANNVPAELRGGLVIRVLSEPGGISQGRLEAVFQNSVAAAGFPSPRVVFEGGDHTVLGRAFNVMERVPGYPMIKALSERPADLAGVACQLARTHAKLHLTPVAGVASALETAGIHSRAINQSGLLSSVRLYDDDPKFGFLSDCASWLFKHEPSRPVDASVCHGDLHPGNVMVNAGEVTGVIDWSAARIAHLEYDLAVLEVLVRAAFFEIVENATPEMPEEFTVRFLDEYRKHRVVNTERLRYYKALRSFQALARGCAASIDGIDSRLVPRDQYPWANPTAIRALVNVLRDVTNVPVRIPEAIDA